MASVEKVLGHFQAALRDLISWLRASATPGVIIGGVAVSLLAKPRITKDMDTLVLLSEEKWENFLAQGAEHGFRPRIQDALQFAFQSRVLLVEHHAAGVTVDISFGALPFEEEAVARAISVRALGVDVPLPTPEDLIVMKAIAARPGDMADIDTVLAMHPEVDQQRIRSCVRGLSDILEQPDLYMNLDSILSRHTRKAAARRKKKDKG